MEDIKGGAEGRREGLAVAMINLTPMVFQEKETKSHSRLLACHSAHIYTTMCVMTYTWNEIVSQVKQESEWSCESASQGSLSQFSCLNVCFHVLLKSVVARFGVILVEHPFQSSSVWDILFRHEKVSAANHT